MLFEADIIRGLGSVIHHVNTVHGLYLFLELKTFIKGNVRDHYLSRAESDELFIHELKALLCLRVITEISFDVILNLHPVGRKKTEDQRYYIDQEKQHSLVYNECGDLQHRAGALFCFFHFPSSVLLLCHIANTLE